MTLHALREQNLREMRKKPEEEATTTPSEIDSKQHSNIASYEESKLTTEQDSDVVSKSDSPQDRKGDREPESKRDRKPATKKGSDVGTLLSTMRESPLVQINVRIPAEYSDWLDKYAFEHRRDKLPSGEKITKQALIISAIEAFITQKELEK